MKDLKGTKTEKNLNDAFAGESMARNNILISQALPETKATNK